MVSLKRFLCGAVVMLASTAAFASNFRAADQIYVNSIAKIPSGTGQFLTAVWIANLENYAVNVDLAYIPTGSDGANAVANAVRVRTLNPLERIQLDDLAAGVPQLATQPTIFGHGVFLACRVGGNCSDCNTNPGDCARISVESRIYFNQPNPGADPLLCRNGSANCTAGQLLSGIPWYNYVSDDAADLGLDKVMIQGVRNTGSRAQGGQPGSGYRTNIVVTNASNTSRIRVKLTLYRNDQPTVPVGTAFVPSQTGFLPALGHTQLNVANFFPGFTGDGFIIAEEDAHENIAGAVDPVAGFMAVGSVLDNVTDDPTTLESVYLEEMDFTCVYGAKPEKRLIKR